MIIVTNISRLRELRKDQTVILPGFSSLLNEEKVEIQRTFGNAPGIDYTAWEKVRGTHPLIFVENHNMVFVDTDKNGTYSGDRLADAISGILTDGNNQKFVTKNDLFMLGLPGRTPAERERSRQDLTRWFGNCAVKGKLTILCQEAD